MHLPCVSVVCALWVSAVVVPVGQSCRAMPVEFLGMSLGGFERSTTPCEGDLLWNRQHTTHCTVCVPCWLPLFVRCVILHCVLSWVKSLVNVMYS
jgi:hypothetical protein